MSPSSTKAAKMGLETSLTTLGRRPQSFEIRCADDDVYLNLPPQRLTSREMVEVGRFILRAISEKHSCRASPSAMASRSSEHKRTPGIRSPSLTPAGYHNQRCCNDRLSAPTHNKESNSKGSSFQYLMPRNVPAALQVCQGNMRGPRKLIHLICECSSGLLCSD